MILNASKVRQPQPQTLRVMNYLRDLKQGGGEGRTGVSLRQCKSVLRFGSTARV